MNIGKATVSAVAFFLCLFKNPEEYDIITTAHILSINGKNERL